MARELEIPPDSRLSRRDEGAAVCGASVGRRASQQQPFARSQVGDFIPSFEVRDTCSGSRPRAKSEDLDPRQLVEAQAIDAAVDRRSGKS